MDTGLVQELERIWRKLEQIEQRTYHNTTDIANFERRRELEQPIDPPDDDLENDDTEE